MIRSMTGFGRSETTLGGNHVSVEVRSLNSRFLDITVRLPLDVQSFEADAREAVQKRLNRGKITLTITGDMESESHHALQIDQDHLRHCLGLLEDIRRQAGITERLRLSDVTRFEQIFRPVRPSEGELQERWRNISTAIGQALDELDAMRAREGGELQVAMTRQIEQIEQQVDLIDRLSEGRLIEARRKLHERIAAIKEDLHLESDRIEQEIVLLADRIDINEELVRLRSHTKFFLQALQSSEPVGRRLNFLTQELNRELNTIGSKAYNSDISHAVVLCKEKVEQIREQVQNVE